MTRFTTESFSRAMRDLASVPRTIAAPLSKEFKKKLDQGFANGVDPYGRAWAKLKPRTLAKGRTPPPLTDTRAGRDSVKVFPGSRGGIKITVGKGYMGFHQDGTDIMARRRILPDARLPASWAKLWQEALTKAVNDRLRRG